MKKRDFIKFNSLLLAIALIIGIFGLSYVPGIYASPDDVEISSEAPSDNSNEAGAALEQRMNEISDDSLYTDVGKYVYEVVNVDKTEESGSTEIGDDSSVETESGSSDIVVSEDKTETSEDETELNENEEDGDDLVENIEESATEQEAESELKSEVKEEAALPSTDTEGESTEENAEENAETEEFPKVETSDNEEEQPQEGEEPFEKTDSVPESEATEMPSYSWQLEDDEAFSGWILAKENKQYLADLFAGENKDEISAIRERINGIDDAAIYQQVNRYIYALINSEEDIEETDISYPWDNMTDEEFAEWVMSGEHDSYLRRILSDEEDKTPSDALEERVSDMKNEELCAYVSQYLEALIASIDAVDPEENPFEDGNKKTYPWDSMTDEEFAAWILSGENNVYIQNVLNDIFNEYVEENGEAVPETTPDKTVDESEKAEVNDPTEEQAFNERVEKIEDVTLLEQVKSFIKELFMKKEEPECEFMTLADEETGVKVEGELPKDVKMQVTRVALEEIEEFVGEGKKVLFAYDIKFFVDCREYQPTSPLSVSVIPSEKTENKISVKHISEDSETGEREIESIRSKVSDDGEITFSADSFSVYYAVADAEDIEYIYLDLYADYVTISNSGYSGAIFTTVNGETVTTPVTGAHSPDNKYYIYQSSLSNRATTGMVDGEMILPEYTPLEYNGKPWAEYITNNTDIEGIIAAWDSVASKERTKIYSNRIYLNTPQSTCDITIDNLWTMSHASTSGGGGGIVTNNPSQGNTKLIVRLVGENRMSNIYYYSGDATTSTLTFTSAEGDGSSSGSLTVIGDQKDLHTNDNYNVKVAANHWMSVIGGSDSYDKVRGLTFKGGTIYAGATAIDNCTAIGGGGNGIGGVTITGGTVTAVSNSTGTAIGGGIAHTGQGGTADVLISGGNVYAYNFGQPAHDIIKTYGDASAAVIEAASHIPGSAIGGASSIMQSGNATTAYVKITGGNVYAESLGGCAIGGGNSVNTSAGSADVTISGGNVVANSVGHKDYTFKDGKKIDIPASVAIGGGRGGINGDGGSATVTISGTPTITTGSVGGGGTTNPNGKLGYAKVNISGGTTSGQFVMARGASSACTFTMTGGIIRNSDTANKDYERMYADGGAVWMDDPNGVATISGGTVENCSAENGGAVYMTDGSFSISGDAEIINCKANSIGGAVCIGNETAPATNAKLNVNGGSVDGNGAKNGGGIALFGGVVNISGGKVENNRATAGSGGGAYINGGNVRISGGSLSKNIASENGGGISVKNGDVILSGGHVDKNVTTSGSGAGIYVSADGSDVSVDILRGTVNENNCASKGGAIAVVGNKEGTEDISVMIGVNEKHYVNDTLVLPFDHIHKSNTYTHTDCPEIKNNVAVSEGGAVYLSGGANTNLDIYCVEEINNTARDGDTKHNFILMEGGNCTISSSQKDSDGNFVEGTADYGNANITGTAYIVGGNMDVWGSMKNPSTTADFTVNIIPDENGNTGHFVDHRPKEEEQELPTAYRIHYYENFRDSGQYTAVHIPYGETTLISGTIYTHPGYEILGWYTNPDGTGKKYEVNSVYDPATFVPEKEGEEYLIIYACWLAHNYHLRFDANVPQNVTYSGAMEDMIDLEFDKDYTLAANKFACVGYLFTGWNTKPDGSGVAYSDGASFRNLTETEGETVTLYAQWNEHSDEPEEPDTPDEHKHEYTYKSQDNVLTRLCKCGIENTATLSARNSVYNGSYQTLAKVTYSSNDPTVSWEPELNHPDAMNAGEYYATVSSGGETAIIKFTISKAEQGKIPTKPAFTEQKSGNKTTFVIDPIASNVLNENETAKVQYRLIYFENAEQKESEWSFDTTMQIPFALTNYYIEARYGETLNYNPSEASRSSSVFYSGKARIEVTADAGITHYEKQGETVDSGVEIHYTIDSGYHKMSTFGASFAESTSASLQHVEDGKFLITSIPNEDCVIKVHISGVKRDAEINHAYTEGEVFGEISGNSAKISRDSAFSAYFDITAFEESDYNPFGLVFESAIPAGTTVIMMDKTKAQPSFWYYEAKTALTQIPLSAFTAMGENNKYSSSGNGEIKAQFIVDFSKTENGYDGGSSLVMTLNSEKKNAEVNDISVACNVKVGFASFALSDSGSVDGLSALINLGFNSEGIASKWMGRRSALVFVPKAELPADARFEVVERIGTNQTTTTYYLLEDNSFILPVGDIGSKNVTLTLKSDMFPTAAKNYSFDCSWIASDTMTGISPRIGEIIAEAKLVFEKESAVKPGIRITSADNGKRVYAINDAINVNVAFDGISENQMKVKATLMFKNESGNYESFGWSQFITEEGKLSIPLGTTPGNYSVMLEGLDTNGFSILRSNYYFIVSRQ